MTLAARGRYTHEPPRFSDPVKVRAHGQQWDSKTRQVIERNVGEYVRAYAEWLLKFPTAVILYYDLLDLPGRRQVETRHDVRLIRGPSRVDYR